MTFPRSHSPSVVETGLTPRNYPLLPGGSLLVIRCAVHTPPTQMHLQASMDQASNPSSAPHQLCDLGRPLTP